MYLHTVIERAVREGCGFAHPEVRQTRFFVCENGLIQAVWIDSRGRRRQERDPVPLKASLLASDRWMVCEHPHARVGPTLDTVFDGEMRRGGEREPKIADLLNKWVA